MIIAITFISFAFGFCAAVAAVTRSSSRHGRNLRELLCSLRLLPHNLHKVLEENSNDHDASSSVFDEKTKFGNLLTKEQVEAQFEPSSWQALAYHDFQEVILAKQTGMKPFPCIYATMGYRAGDHRYVFLRSDNPAEPQNIRLIAPALQEYLAISQSLGPNTSLVIVGAPSKTEKPVDDYNRTFWDMLRGLRMVDRKAWPKDVPEMTDSEKWMFCFNGEPVFPVMLTPAHTRRWSRHMSVPIIALQPKWVLDKLLATPEKKEAATGKVRKLLKEYDQIDISPDLTSYGQPGTSEVRQLCLLDENVTANCPYDNFDG